MPDPSYILTFEFYSFLALDLEITYSSCILITHLQEV
jgi:hypothetical protein